MVFDNMLSVADRISKFVEQIVTFGELRYVDQNIKLPGLAKKISRIYVTQWLSIGGYSHSMGYDNHYTTE